MKYSLQTFVFRRREKPGFFRTTGQKEVGEQATGNSRSAFQHEEPAPTAKSQPMNVVQNKTRNRGTDDLGYWSTKHEQGKSLRTFATWKPAGKVKDYARKVTGLRQPKQEAH